MGKIWEDDAWEEYQYWIETDKRTLKRINKLIDDAYRNAHSGIGKPEKLKGNLVNWYSRRIDEKNRLIYRIEGNDMYILSCKGHYE